MNNSAFRYALNTSWRGLLSLYTGNPSLADDEFMIEPSDVHYYGNIGNFHNLSFLAHELLYMLFDALVKNIGVETMIELEQYEDIMGI